MMASAGVPKDIITKLHAEIVKAVNLLEVRERFMSLSSRHTTENLLTSI